MTGLERALETVKSMVEGERIHGIYTGFGLTKETIQDYILLTELAKDPAVIARAAEIEAELKAGTRDPEVEL